MGMFDGLIRFGKSLIETRGAGNIALERAGIPFRSQIEPLYNLPYIGGIIQYVEEYDDEPDYSDDYSEEDV